MNTDDVLTQVQERAKELRCQVILDALENLNRNLKQAKNELDSLPVNATSTQIERAQQKYQKALATYRLMRISLHHVRKWLRDGEDYAKRDLYADYKLRDKIRNRYDTLKSEVETAREKKNEALLQVNPELAEKKIARNRSSKPLRDVPIRIY